MDKIDNDEMLERFNPDKLNLKKQDLLDFCHSCIDEWRLNTRANFKYIVAMELMIGAVKISSEDVMKTLWTKILVWFNDLQWKNALAEKDGMLKKLREIGSS
tara:strand:- start:181 stop:486 length:306 start_codon:yes stop_codon:yes gene_type:complete